MSETTTEQVQETVVDNPNPFAEWSEALPTPPASTETVAETTTEVIPPTTEPTVVTPTQTTTANEWYKTYGWDNEDAAKTEITKLKEQKPQEITFADEQSKHIHDLIREGKKKEVREFLETQERLERFTTTEVSDDNAADIIKMNMQLKYKDLSQKEIEYKYNKDYGLPKEPTQKIDELEEEFAERKSEWQAKIDDIKMARNIEAKLARPELEKLKSQIVLPEITKPAPQAAANQLSEAQLQEIRNNFLKALDSNYNKFEGFTTKVKDESVEIPLQFKIPDEDKVAIKGRLTEGFDVNDYMDKRWFDGSGTPKIEDIMGDLYLLENRDKILSGIANNAANKRLEEHLKSTKNPSIMQTATPTPTFQQNGNGNVSPFADNAWSEKPPLIQN